MKEAEEILGRSTVLPEGIPCKHSAHHIAEREFYNKQKYPYSGTLIICKKCGANIFIKDKKYGVYKNPQLP